MLTTCLISWVSNAWQSENIGLPRIQLSNDAHTHLLHRWIQVHHLVSDSQLVNEFLHTTTPDEFITNTHTHPRLTAFCPGLPGWADTRKVKPIWISLKQTDGEWQWHQLGHMQVCTSLQTYNHASTPPLSFYRPDALPAAQPTHTTVSKHWRQFTTKRRQKRG